MAIIVRSLYSVFSCHRAFMRVNENTNLSIYTKYKMSRILVCSRYYRYPTPEQNILRRPGHTSFPTPPTFTVQQTHKITKYLRTIHVYYIDKTCMPLESLDDRRQLRDAVSRCVSLSGGRTTTTTDANNNVRRARNGAILSPLQPRPRPITYIELVVVSRVNE